VVKLYSFSDAAAQSKDGLLQPLVFGAKQPLKRVRVWRFAA
jgi:hypothetical protein